MTAQTDSNVPQIRYKGFEEDWEKRRFRDIVSNLSGGASIKPEDYQKNGIRTVPKGAVNSSGIADLSGSKYVSNDFFARNQSSKVSTGNLITSLRDLVPSAPNLGRLVKLEGKAEDFLMPQGVYKIELHFGVDEAFVISYSNGERFRKIIASEKNGSTQVHLRNGEFLDIGISTPSHLEQTKIGEYFREMDRLIGLHQRKHDKLVTLKKAMLQKMFPQPGATTPEIRFKGFSGEWVEKKIHEMFQVTRGNVLAATKTSPKQTTEAPYPVYSSQTKSNGLMGYYKSYLFEDAITWTTDGANAGTVCYREGKFYSTNVNGVLLSDRGYANRAVSESLNQEAWKHVSHVGNPKLMNNVMSQIKIFVPDTIGEQQKIGTYFRTLDSLISKHAIQLQKLQQIKSACLEKMFV